MAVLHGKGLQDLSHHNEGADLRGSELTVRECCKWTALYWDQAQDCRKETRIVVAMPKPLL